MGAAMRGLIEWWLERSQWVRYGFAAAFLAVSTILYFTGWIWIWGWAIGGTLILVNLMMDE